jgi:hypothetical protein
LHVNALTSDGTTLMTMVGNDDRTAVLDRKVAQSEPAPNVSYQSIAGEPPSVLEPVL